jgi:hypothetical protein
MVSGLSYTVSLLFKGNLVIAGKGIVVGAFVDIAENTMMMALFGVMVSALADTGVSAFISVVLTHVRCLPW